MQATCRSCCFCNNWLKQIYVSIGMPESKTSVIMSGVDEKVFNENGLSKLNKEKLNL